MELQKIKEKQKEIDMNLKAIQEESTSNVEFKDLGELSSVKTEEEFLKVEGQLKLKENRRKKVSSKLNFSGISNWCFDSSLESSFFL